jgi:di/tricarboxylate transporter
VAVNRPHHPPQRGLHNETVYHSARLKIGDKAPAKRVGGLADSAQIGGMKARRWLVIVLFALLSLGWQSLVVQTHCHFENDALEGPAVAAAAHLSAPTKAPGQAPLDCPLCRQAAQAGHYLLAAGVPALVPPAVVAMLLVRIRPFWQARHRPVGWRSRGPPTFS